MELVIPNLRDGYVDLCQAVLTNGRKRSPRGMLTYNVAAATVVIEDPRDTLPIGIGRNPRCEIGAAEAIQLVGGFTAPQMLVSITEVFERFMVGGTLHGAYGPRVFSQMPDVERRIRADQDTRQAWVNIWDPAYDRDDWPDMPCTTALSFEVEDGKLVCHSTMRSNDVWLGLAYDAFQFGQLQCTLANVLDLPVGPLYHQAKSLHLYDRDIAKLDDLHSYVSGVRAHVPLPEGFRGATIRDAQLAARRVFVDPSSASTPTEGWYASMLGEHVPAGRH